MNSEVASLFDKAVLWYTGEEQANPSTKTIIVNGNVTQYTTHNGVTSPVSGSGIGYFDGNGDYLTLPDVTDLDLSTGDFTVEAYVNYTALKASNHQIIHWGANSTTAYSSLNFNISQQGQLILAVSTSGTSWAINSQTGTTVLSATTWHHVALTRKDGIFYVWLNGVLEFSNSTVLGTLYKQPSNIIGGALYSGYSGGSGDFFYGYISEFRITKGVAKYTANFSSNLPTTPFIPDANTKLLLHFANTAAPTVFLDSAKTYASIDCPILPSGVTVTNYGTFGRLDLGNNHVVRNFNSSNGTYVQISSNSAFNPGTGNYTVCGWVKFDSLSTVQYIIGRGAAGDAMFDIYWNTVGNNLVASELSFAFTPVISTWYFFTVIRSGTDFKAYINNVQIGSTQTNTYNNTFTALYIGAQYTGNLKTTGNLKDLLLYVGRALTLAELTTIMRLTDPRAASMGEGISPGVINGQAFDYFKVV